MFSPDDLYIVPREDSDGSGLETRAFIPTVLVLLTHGVVLSLLQLQLIILLRLVVVQRLETKTFSPPTLAHLEDAIFLM